LAKRETDRVFILNPSPVPGQFTLGSNSASYLHSVNLNSTGAL